MTKTPPLVVANLVILFSNRLVTYNSWTLNQLKCSANQRIKNSKFDALTFTYLSPNLAGGNRISCGVLVGSLTLANDHIRKNRKAGVIPARARHCNWGALRHGESQSLYLRTGTGRRRKAWIHKSVDLPHWEYHFEDQVGSVARQSLRLERWRLFVWE